MDRAPAFRPSDLNSKTLSFSNFAFGGSSVTRFFFNLFSASSEMVCFRIVIHLLRIKQGERDEDATRTAACLDSSPPPTAQDNS